MYLYLLLYFCISLVFCLQMPSLLLLANTMVRIIPHHPKITSLLLTKSSFNTYLYIIYLYIYISISTGPPPRLSNAYVDFVLGNDSNVCGNNASNACKTIDFTVASRVRKNGNVHLPSGVITFDAPRVISKVNKQRKREKNK